MKMRVLLVKLKHKDKDLSDRLKENDAEFEQLKTKLISKKEEQEDPDEESEEIEETREFNHDLKTQL